MTSGPEILCLRLTPFEPRETRRACQLQHTSLSAFANEWTFARCMVGSSVDGRQPSARSKSGTRQRQDRGAWSWSPPRPKLPQKPTMYARYEPFRDGPTADTPRKVRTPAGCLIAMQLFGRSPSSYSALKSNRAAGKQPLEQENGWIKP